MIAMVEGSLRIRQRRGGLTNSLGEKEVLRGVESLFAGVQDSLRMGGVVTAFFRSPWTEGAWIFWIAPASDAGIACGLCEGKPRTEHGVGVGVPRGLRKDPVPSGVSSGGSGLARSLDCRCGASGMFVSGFGAIPAQRRHIASS